NLRRRFSDPTTALSARRVRLRERARWSACRFVPVPSAQARWPLDVQSSGRFSGLPRRRLGRDLPPIPKEGMDMQRTFPAPYVDPRVKRPDFPLAEALAWYMADKPSIGEGTAATTMRTYFSHLRRFIDWLGPE